MSRPRLQPLVQPLAVLALVLLLSGCASTAAPPAAQPTTAPQTSTAETAPPAAGEESACEMSLATRWVRTSAEHEAAYLQTYRYATLSLEAQTAELEPGTWAVALDADETVIDNSRYQMERERQCRGYSSESWRAWVRRREAKPLPGAQAFLQRVQELGGVVAIVTNRDQAECPDTMANFEAVGLPYDLMLCQKTTGEKEPRWESVANGTASPDLPPLKLVMWLGDNIGDFPNLDQSIRNQGPMAFRHFGTRYFVLPNPMYGSWQRNPEE